jgi:NAD(P)-dependent dehydrogenase (short-subunit alcohol dehydrogenase family)
MKTALVTGSNRGIGLGFTKYLLNQGYQVFAGTRVPQEYPPELANNPNLVIVKIDIANDDLIHSAVQDVMQHTDHLDLLVNNASINKDSATDGHKGLVCNLQDLDRDLMNKMFDVNATSQMMVLKAVLPLMTVDPSFVINISSGRSSYKDECENTYGNYGYRASKAALNMLTHASVFDIPPNVKTFAVHPGLVKTDMNPLGEDDALVQAEKMLDITKNWKEEFNGMFLRWDGTLYPL